MAVTGEIHVETTPDINDLRRALLSQLIDADVLERVLEAGPTTRPDGTGLAGSEYLAEHYAKFVLMATDRGLLTWSVLATKALHDVKASTDIQHLDAALLELQVVIRAWHLDVQARHRAGA